MKKNLLKKIIISILIFFSIFFLIGFIKKQFLVSKEETKKIVKINSEFQTQEKEQEKFLNIQSSVNSQNTTTPQIQLFLAETEELQKEIESEFIKLTKDLYPDHNKSITQYQKEIEEAIKKVNIQYNNNQINYQDLIDLSKNLAAIKPPSIFFSTHKEFIKVYLKAGLILKAAQKTQDPFKQIFLYNMVKEVLNEIKI